MPEQPSFPAFDDGKEPDALRTIGEVAAALGIRQHVLRYWEEQFPMLRPIKRSGGRRYFRPEDIRLVATIHRLVHDQGYTLRGARLAIEAGETGVPLLSPPVAGQAAERGRPLDGPQDKGQIAAKLREIRNMLASALAEA